MFCLMVEQIHALASGSLSAFGPCWLSVAYTCLGTDNLPGVNSLLRGRSQSLRKIKLTPGKEQMGKESNLSRAWCGFPQCPNRLKKLQGDPNVLRGSDLAALILQHLEKLRSHQNHFLRNSSGSIEPVILFQKMGVGCLELYILIQSNVAKK